MRKILAGTFLAAALFAAPDRFPEEAADSQAIRDEQYRQMDRYFEEQIARAEKKRAQYWAHLDFSSPAAFDRSVQHYRDDWAKFLAVPSPGETPLNIKQLKVHEFDTYTAYRVWFDTLPGVQSYGILLVPKQPGRKPALVCLHGHLGTPEIVAGLLADDVVKKAAYHGFGRTAVQRGYVVWCPMIQGYYSEEHEPHEGPDAKGRDLLQKKALLSGGTLMGLEVAKIRRGVDFLQTLPDVDRDRIGIYGLSKGGHYTLYSAGLETRFKVAVISGWFNERRKKLTAAKDEDNPSPFLPRVHRSEYYLKDLLDRFGDAELAWLIAPRPVMIEAGTQDDSVNYKFAREEFRRVESVYGKLHLSDRARFAQFEGPHEINGTESFPFIDRWLKHE
jgi:dienelactone hydrolase